ncbi:TRAP-type C4-dicarboxylate transport system, small permease component [Alteribacillus persepolensis]|uniref:TRAP-type C4-dicarboxylate transport system, small permease component n=1 Tax=Alteribacillus persepolensis TaxID=568899 RepID=A0A1G8A6G4_9BACI|nr:TRAP transporter small permease [Alteribacillus persepolensis]SDH16542.1 TRAP-type C4-dicarboxylate transport system, small permease component [Alteribacillus persepolensis]
MVHHIDRWFQRFIKGMSKAVEVICMISVGAIAVVTILAFVSRYILQSPIIGTDEIALYLLVWITLLGAALGIHKNDMVALTLVKDRMNGKSLTVLNIILQLIIFLFSLLGLWFGTIWLLSSSILEAVSASLEIPLWIPFMIFPVSMLIMAVFSLNNIIKQLKNREVSASEAGEGEST